MSEAAKTCGYKAKTIKSVIRRKVDHWLKSIDDESLRSALADKVIVTGGCVASMLLGEEVKDFDIYLRDHDSVLALANYYLGKFSTRKHAGIDVPLSVEDDGIRIRIVAKSSGIASEEGTEKPYQYFESQPDQESGEYVSDVITDPGTIEEAYEETEEKAQKTKGDAKAKYRPVFMTSNAITLSDRVQIILRFYGEPDTIHENYDYVHCTNYWKSWDGGELVLRPAALEALLSRTLNYVGSKYPICSAVRMRKFVQRGWRINAGQILKMSMQISSLDLTDIKVLEDQLTGVDTAYFVQLIERLKEKDPEKVDSAYLVEIIDRIF
jgi:hypothetical protein